MPKRPRAPVAARHRPTVLSNFSAIRLARLVDDHEDLFADEWLVYRRVRALCLEDYGETTVVVAKLLDQIDNNLVEAAIRQAGFVVGFELCRRLLMGELTIHLDDLEKRAIARAVRSARTNGGAR